MFCVVEIVRRYAPAREGVIVWHVLAPDRPRAIRVESIGLPLPPELEPRQKPSTYG